MSKKQLVHKCQIALDGKDYQILVYSCSNGRVYAETALGRNDIIINDGTSLKDVLEKHSRLLPLAVTSREMRSQLRDLS